MNARLTYQSRPQFRPRAFTLIEVLLAVGIFAIVLASINTVFYAALRLRNKTAQLLDQTVPEQQALAFLRRDLRAAAAPGILLAGPMQSVASSNSMSLNDGLQFYTTTGVLSDDVPWGDIQKVVYQLKPPTNSLTFTGLSLVRTVTRNLLPTLQEEHVDEYLMGNVQQMAFTYYDGTNWTATWDSTTTGGLPLAVRVQIQKASESEQPLNLQRPIELLVPLLAQSSTNQSETAEP